MAASNVVDLLLRFKGDSSDLKSTMAQVRSELASSQKSQQAAGKSELTMKAQLAAASSLQRQRSAALIGEWKKTEHAASMLARGVKPVSENLQRVTDAMGALRGVSSTLEGPLGAVSGRLGAVSALAAKLGPVGGGIALAIAGMTAMVVVTGLLAKATFDVIKSTADWQGKLHDLSQQVGVSVETLNALEISARKTGGSIDSIAQALVIYQGNLDEAQDASSKAGKQFSELGISTDNTEQSFRDAFKALAAMEVGFHQTNTAAELFGRRGGKQVLAIIRETNGDIDSAVTKLGSLAGVTTEQARVADEFNDAMVDVGIMIRGVTALVVQDAIPQVLKVLEDLSRLFKENKDVIDALGGAFTAFIRANVEGVLIPGLNFLRFTLEVNRIAWAELEFAMLKAAGVSVDAAAMIANARLQASRDAASIFAGVTGGFTSQGGPTAGLGAPERAKGSGGGRSEKLSAGQRLLNSLTEEYNRISAKTNELTRAQVIEQELLGKKYKGTSDAILTQIRSLATWITIDLEAAEATKKGEEATKKKEAALKALDEFIAKQTNSVREARLQEDGWDKEIRELTKTLQNAGVSIKQETLDIIANNDAMLKAISLTRERIVLEQTLIERQERKRYAEDKNLARSVGVDLSEGDETRPRRVFDAAKDTRSEIDKLFDHINENLSGSKQTAALAGLSAMTEAFGSLGQAVGQAAYAWVLYGNAGTSIRKITAEILASVAQQALVKSVFQLAEGFAALFLNPAEAAAHFKAAAIYASIGGIAAIAGRAAAGNSFNQGSSASSGFGSASGGSNSSRGGGGNTSPITLGSQRPQVVHLVIEHRSGGLFDSRVVSAVVKSANGGGAIREAVIKEIKRQE